MNQVGLEKHWLEFLRIYVQPIQKNVFIGYSHDVCGMNTQTKLKQYVACVCSLLAIKQFNLILFVHN